MGGEENGMELRGFQSLGYVWHMLFSEMVSLFSVLVISQPQVSAEVSFFTGKPSLMLCVGVPLREHSLCAPNITLFTLQHQRYLLLLNQLYVIIFKGLPYQTFNVRLIMARVMFFSLFIQHSQYQTDKCSKSFCGPTALFWGLC